MARDDSVSDALLAYGLLHERGAAAVVAEPGDVRGGLAADVVVAFADDEPENAARVLGGVLPDESLGVIVVPRGARRRVRRALAGARLVLRLELLALPSAARPERLLSVDRRVLAVGLRAGGLARRVGSMLLTALPGAAAAVRPGTTALVVERPGPRRYGVWLQTLVPDADPRRVIVQRSRRDGVVALWSPTGRDPAAYVKLGAVSAEAAALERLAGPAGAAGARVPKVIGTAAQALATTAVTGRSAAAVLAARPERFSEVVERIARWLERWHARTASPRAWTSADSERYLLEPLSLVGALVTPSYADWLARRAAAFEGIETGFAPAHGDLTTANVLLDGDTIGLVDWEEATAEAPPFVDLPYALADAAAARDRFRDRPGAFERLFGSDAPDAGIAASLLARAVVERGLHPAALSLAFHACWLHHAANDVRRGVADRPFVAIAAAVAADPERYDPFGSA